MPVKVVVPPGARDGRRSLLVFLHGRGEDEKSYLVEPMFRALAKAGGKAPVVAFPEGGPDSYWHDRDDGEWGSYVLDEVVPEIAERFEIEPERIAIGGISMGGFGALDIAAIDPDRFCAVGAHSPAIWENAGDTASGAFDNDEDFDRHDVFTELGPPGDPLAGKRVWLDVGGDDPFAATRRRPPRRARGGRRQGPPLRGRRRPRERLLERQLEPLHAVLRTGAEEVPGGQPRRPRGEEGEAGPGGRQAGRGTREHDGEAGRAASGDDRPAAKDDKGPAQPAGDTSAP